MWSLQFIDLFYFVFLGPSAVVTAKLFAGAGAGAGAVAIPHGHALDSLRASFFSPLSPF